MPCSSTAAARSDPARLQGSCCRRPWLLPSVAIAIQRVPKPSAVPASGPLATAVIPRVARQLDTQKVLLLAVAHRMEHRCWHLWPEALRHVRRLGRGRFCARARAVLIQACCCSMLQYVTCDMDLCGIELQLRGLSSLSPASFKWLLTRHDTLTCRTQTAAAESQIAASASSPVHRRTMLNPAGTEATTNAGDI